MLAVATWSRPVDVKPRPVNAYNARTEKTAGFTFPVLGALTTLAIVFAASIGHIERAALLLATAALLVVGARLVFTVRRGGHQLGTLSFPDRQRLGHDRGGRSQFRGRLHNPLFTTGARVHARQVQGKPVNGLAHPDDAGSMVAHLGQLAEGSTEVASFETRMRHRDGAWRTIASTATDLRAIHLWRVRVQRRGRDRSPPSG